MTKTDYDPLQICADLAEIASALECGNAPPKHAISTCLNASQRIADLERSMYDASKRIAELERPTFEPLTTAAKDIEPEMVKLPWVPVERDDYILVRDTYNSDYRKLDNNWQIVYVPQALNVLCKLAAGIVAVGWIRKDVWKKLETAQEEAQLAYRHIEKIKISFEDVFKTTVRLPVPVRKVDDPYQPVTTIEQRKPL